MVIGFGFEIGLIWIVHGRIIARRLFCLHFCRLGTAVMPCPVPAASLDDIAHSATLEHQ